MKRFFLNVILLTVASATYGQLSVKVGYGPDHLSQIGDNDHELFAQVQYAVSNGYSLGIGVRQFNNVTAYDFVGSISFPDDTYINAREDVDINSKEIYAISAWEYKKFCLALSAGYARYTCDSDLSTFQVNSSTNEAVVEETYSKSYETFSNFRAGIDLSYNIRLIDRLYLSPYGRYHRDFRPQSISFDLESMETLDPLFANVPEIDEFNAESKAFTVKRAIVVFGLALKYQLW